MKKQILTGLILIMTAKSVFAKTAMNGDVVQKGNQIVISGTVSCSVSSIADTAPVDLNSKNDADYKIAAQTSLGFTIMGRIDEENFSISGNPGSGSVTFTLTSAADIANPKRRPNRLRSTGDFVKQGVVALDVSKDGRTVSMSCVKIN